MAAGLVLRQALAPFGSCGFFAGSFPASPALPAERIVAGGRRYAQFSPPGWLDAYGRRGLDRGNPVIFAPARRVSPFRWSAPGFPDLEGWRGLRLARELGVQDGLAVPCHEPGGRVGVVSMGLLKGTRESALSNPTGITYAVPVRFVHELLKQPR